MEKRYSTIKLPKTKDIKIRKIWEINPSTRVHKVNKDKIKHKKKWLEELMEDEI